MIAESLSVNEDSHEWATLFSERLFVFLQVYADESGTHAGAPIATVGGFVDSPENWEQFRPKWKTALNNFRTPYFHFREFASRALCSDVQSPYYNWSHSKRRAFLYRLAFVASLVGVPIGGASNTKHRLKEEAIATFYDSLCATLDTHWPDYGGKVLIIFDGCKHNNEWRLALHTVHNLFRERDNRIGALTFEDDKDPKHTALQAADLMAYSFRQHAERHIATAKGEDTILRVLNFILYRNIEPRLKVLNDKEWERVISCIQEDEKELTKKWAKQGHPERIYEPDKDFNFDKYKRRLANH